jgi:hypothetical protein
MNWQRFQMQNSLAGVLAVCGLSTSDANLLIFNVGPIRIIGIAKWIDYQEPAGKNL